MRSDFKPDRDWRILFGSFLFLAIIVFLASVYLYWSLDTLEAVGRAKMLADSEIQLDQPALERVVATLNEKKARLETLLTTPPVIVDPAR
jgi:hypothetical protein